VSGDAVDCSIGEVALETFEVIADVALTVVGDGDVVVDVSPGTGVFCGVGGAGAGDGDGDGDAVAAETAFFTSWLTLRLRIEVPLC